MKLNFKLLTYDIETSYLKARVWRLGEQVVRHDQLDPVYSMYKIYTLSYKWYGQKEVVTLIGDDIIEKFDEQVRQADVVIGKNNERFDNVYVNTQRLLQGLKPLPEWIYVSDDIEKQIRRFFKFPSNSLDYISKLFGFGGKVKMEASDWEDIANYELLNEFSRHIADLNPPIAMEDFISVNEIFSQLMFKKPVKKINKLGEKAWKKMIFYNKKDVIDTENVILKVLPHVKLKHNAATKQDGKGCITCGSLKVIPTRIISAGQTRYQLFDCEDHNGYAGRATVRYDKHRNKIFGKMG